MALAPAGVFAQSSASISGVVKDTAGAVLPGVSVTVKNDTTAAAQEVTTDASGAYRATALEAGSYTVSAALGGFKTAIAKMVRVAPGQPVSIPLTLEIGQLEETVTVTSSSELINTQNATVAATLNADQLTRLPTPTRNALNAVTFLPGINTTGTNRDSTINGLPETFVSISIDGVSNNDNFLRGTDSFFASITPRQDAVEAVAVTLSAGGAQVGGGSGAVTMAFQTRSGGNRFTGSAYEYYRNPSFNSNYIFNEFNHQGKNEITLNQFGARLGGPIVIPGVYDGHDRAFFFFHYEQIRFPNSFTRTRTVYNPKVNNGVFRYQFGSEVREVNLLTLAAANGQISAKDPTMVNLLGLIDSSTRTTGTRAAGGDPLYDNYVWQSPSELFEHQPTTRIDYNLSNDHRLNGSFSFITAKRTPDYLNNADPRFPGAPNQRDYVSKRPLLSVGVRSVMSKDVINELRGGLTAFYGSSSFGYGTSFPSRNDASTFDDSNGYAVSAPANTITDWFTSNGPSWRAAPTYSLEDTLTWNRRRHTITAGGNVLISNAESSSQQIVPGITLGFNTDFDPAASMFNTTNFPGASTANLDAARATYAVLTGRVASVNSQAVLDPGTGQYVELAPQTLEGGLKVFGMFAQDTWRLRSNLTLTGGLRYDIQTPFAASTSVMSAVTMDSVCGTSGLGDGGDYSRCNFLQPGAPTGVRPEYVLLEEGTQGYKTDLNNLAPSVSIAWRPDVQSGFLRAFLGDPNQATLRAGYSEAYDRQGLTRFTDLYGGNRGASISLSRGANTGLVPAGESWPVLLSQTNRLYSQAFNPDPTYPIAVGANRADSLNAFAPDIQIARARTWSVGFARSISRDMAVEIRYVGNRADSEWSSINYNCQASNNSGCTSIRGENLAANGFLNEFKQAMGNLAANNASGVAGRVGSFAYFGSGTGTSPLPIYLAYLNGSTDAGNPAAYGSASTTWANSTIAGRLAAPNPNPNAAAVDLDGNLTRRTQAQRIGYPANFFVVNPDVANANVTDSGAFSKYNALQIEMRRRLSKGFAANVNYQYAFEGGSQFDGFSFGRAWTETPVTGNPTVRHAIKFQADWSLPFGRGERFAGDASSLLNALIGGWSVTGVGRYQRVLQDFGNVRLIGMTVDDLQSIYKFYRKSNADTGIDEVWMLPDDVILNTRRAFSTINTTLDGYSTSLGAPEGRYIAPANSATCIQIKAGDCAPRNVLVLAPWFQRFDFGAAKKIGIGGSKNVEVRFDLLNLFDNPNFNQVANPGTGATIFRVTSAYTDASNTYDPGGRIGQLMIRLNW